MSAAHCNKCKKSHARPVGKKCTRYLEPTPTGEGATPNQLLLNAIQGLQGTMEGVLERVTSLEAVRSRSRSPSPSQEHLPEHTGSRDKDSIAARVTHALKDFGLDDDGTPAEDTPTGGKNIHSSRKSGRTRTTEDLIVRYVHWPHFRIYKGPSRKPAAYDDLSMPEFVAGTSTVYSVTTRTTTTRITCSTTCKTLYMTPPCTHGVTCVIFTGSSWG